MPNMSMLAPDVHAELAQLLEALQSRDNGIRSQAEEHLQSNWVAARPEVLLMGLAEQISAPKDSGVCIQRLRVPARLLTRRNLPVTLICRHHLPKDSHQDEEDADV